LFSSPQLLSPKAMRDWDAFGRFPDFPYLKRPSRVPPGAERTVAWVTSDVSRTRREWDYSSGNCSGLSPDSLLKRQIGGFVFHQITSQKYVNCLNLPTILSDELNFLQNLFPYFRRLLFEVRSLANHFCESRSKDRHLLLRYIRFFSGH